MAFSYCSGLRKIVIPASVTSIGEFAFYGCTELTIYCRAKEKPSGWADNWSDDNRRVDWGYTDTDDPEENAE